MVSDAKVVSCWCSDDNESVSGREGGVGVEGREGGEMSGREGGEMGLCQDAKVETWFRTRRWRNGSVSGREGGEMGLDAKVEKWVWTRRWRNGREGGEMCQDAKVEKWCQDAKVEKWVCVRTRSVRTITSLCQDAKVDKWFSLCQDAEVVSCWCSDDNEDDRERLHARGECERSPKRRGEFSESCGCDPQ